MASLIRKPFIIALQLQLCTARPRTRYSRGLPMHPALLVRGFVSRKKGSRSMGEEKKEGEKNKIIIMNTKKKEEKNKNK